MKTQAYFQNIRNTLLEELERAETEIIVAVAWFTDRKLFKLLLEKAGNGIAVQLMVADDDINRQYGPDYEELVTVGGVVIKVSAPNPDSLMHNKFCVIDRKTVITGSYNWSKRATNNHENITITWDEPLLSKQFQAEFERLKKQYLKSSPTNKQTFDYGKVSQRLQMIQSLINLNEFQELELQLEKLQQFELIPEVEEIIELIRKSYYSDALTLIDQLKSRYSSLVSLDADKIATLKFEIIYLEMELSSLQGQHDMLDRTVADFRYQVKIRLGNLILSLLNLKIEWNKLREKLGKAFKYEELKEEYRQFEEEVHIAKEKNKTKLSEADERSIKELYRLGVQLCHPDKVQEPHKSKAQEVFIRLKKAFDENNIEEVRNIVTSLENGIWDFGPDISEAKEVEKLESFVRELKLRVQELKIRINELASDEDYVELQKYGSLEAYLQAQEIGLKKDVVNLQEKISSLKHEQSAATE